MERGKQHCCLVRIAMAAGEDAGEFISLDLLSNGMTAWSNHCSFRMAQCPWDKV